MRERLNLGWLRQARRNRKLTLAAAAESIGKDRSTMWRYENDETPMTVDTLLQVLALYGVSVVDVIERIEEVPANGI